MIVAAAEAGVIEVEEATEVLRSMSEQTHLSAARVILIRPIGSRIGIIQDS